MAGTKEGGQKSAETNKKRHGKNFYHKIGAEGGRNGRIHPKKNKKKVGKNVPTQPQDAKASE